MSSSNFTDSAQAVVGTSGTFSVTFQSVQLGYIWTGSVQVPNAAPSSVLPVKFTAFDSGIPIGSWYNDQSSGNLQVRQQLSITGSGLTPATLRAFFTGMISPELETPPFWPGPTPAPPVGGFTTLISGLGNGTAIGGNRYLNASGNPVASPVWFPVVVGTALEIAYMQTVAANMRITPLWSTTGTGAGVIVHNADTFDLSFVAPNNTMQGMTYLNHGPFVAFLVQGVGATPSVVINTGLPPLIRPPSVPQGVLFYSNPPLGASNINLPPYVGPAFIMMSPNNTAGFGYQIVGFDYTGATIVQTRHEQGWPAGTGPFSSGEVVYLPPLINQVQVVGAPAGSTVSGVASGP